jgi:hypothetical protein
LNEFLPSDLDVPGSCTGILTGESGVISTMGYPDGYIGGLSCYWMIYPPPAKEIRLTFHDFNLEKDNEGDCRGFDYLEVRIS